MTELELITEGLWRGWVTKEDYDSPIHGKWLIGDKWAKDSPAFHAQLRYKRWFGHEAKYGGGGYEVPPDPHQGRDEFVMVMSKGCKGSFECVIEGQRHYMTYPRSVDLKPDKKRIWRLPAGASDTEGVTICRFLNEKPTVLGGSLGYEFHVLDLERDSEIPCYLAGPTALDEWRYCLIDMFQGVLHFTTPQQGPELTVGCRQHVFIRRDVFPMRWVIPTMPVRATIVYF